MQYDSRDAVVCLNPGEYQGTLRKCEETTSKKGKPMAILTWEVYGDDRSVFLKEYIVVPDGVWKIRKLAQAWHKEAEFSANTFQPEDMIGENLTLVLKIESQEGFDDKNIISAYKPFERKLTEVTTTTESGEEIPF